MARMLTVEYLLPSREQCAEAHRAERASCLEELIYEFQPLDGDADLWRSLLSDALAEVIQEDRQSRVGSFLREINRKRPSFVSPPQGGSENE